MTTERLTHDHGGRRTRRRIRGLPRLRAPVRGTADTGQAALLDLNVWDGPAVGVVRPTISLVIPAMNEARNLPHVAARIPTDIDEIIFVDGHSVDDTVEVSRRLWPTAVQITQTRKGKGNALACGFAAATGDIVVMLDADGSTDPAEIPRYIGALVSGADFAKGSRFIQGGGSADITKIRRVGNWCLNATVNGLFGSRYTDLCYGYNAFWRRCLDVMELPAIEGRDHQWGDGFEIETLINVRIAASGLAVAEVHSFERSRIHGVSNLNAVRDGLRVLRTIGTEFRRLRGATERSRPTDRLHVVPAVVDVEPPSGSEMAS